jgi:hypothetical protein
VANHLFSRVKRRGEIPGRPALDLIEEAVHLLRQTPPRLWLAYLAGSVPFVLGLLYFWADMSVSAVAAQRAPVAALGMALLFVWLKCWQAVFASGLQAQISAQTPESWSVRRVLSLVAVQGIVQPTKLFLLPLAAIITLPLAWVFAFYENMTVLAAGDSAGVRATLRRAGNQARAWPWQNHYTLVALSLLAGVLWINAIVAAATTPFLLKMLLGIETSFTRGGISSVFNTTFLTATAALAWLAFDPVVKAVYALRCFYSDARKDGADLLAELSRVQARNAKPLAVVAALCLIVVPGLVAAQSASSSGAAPVAPIVTPQELDEALRATLTHEKYLWRMPRVAEAETDPTRGWVLGLIDGMTETTARWARAVRDFVRDIYLWLERNLGGKKTSSSSSSGSGDGWQTVLRVFAFGLLAIAAAALGVLLYRVWRQGGWRRPEAVRAEVIAAKPDLADERVTAAQLPEDEWLALARELMERGELRLALRALYFAGLAHLAQRELVSLAQFQSHRDYELEVGRRARGQSDLRAAFGVAVRAFDRSWYGRHEVTPEGLEDFRSNLERIRAC